MKQYRYKGLYLVEKCILIWIKIVRDGDITFSGKSGETGYDYGVKFLNPYDRIYDN